LAKSGKTGYTNHGGTGGSMKGMKGRILYRPLQNSGGKIKLMIGGELLSITEEEFKEEWYIGKNPRVAIRKEMVTDEPGYHG